MEVWQSSTLASTTTYRWALGPLALWLHAEGDELQLAAERGDELAEARRSMPLEPWRQPTVSELEWVRWVAPASAGGIRVRFEPAMPDRAVVARPESAVRLPTGAAALFFLSIPIWVRMVGGGGAEGEAELTLTEMPSMVLSNIWFGDPMNGELCYSLPTTARRAVEQTVSRPHRAICPVHLRNESSEELPVQRLRVQVAPLTVFDAGSRLWTNRVNVRHQGGEAGTLMEVEPGPPEQAAAEATIAGAPREGARKGRWTRALSVLGSMF